MMNCINALKSGAIRITCLPHQPLVNSPPKRFRRPSPCDFCFQPPDKKPCFDIRNVDVERGNQCHARMIRSFLYTHYWSREPSVQSLWMPLDSPYIAVLTDKFALSGDRLVAYERLPRTGERKLVGVSVANKIYPWVPDELEEWAHYTSSRPERHRMYFSAHCYRSPDLFKKFKVPYIYEVEVLATASEVTGQGVGTLLLKTVLAHALELRHPLVQVIAISHYVARICEKLGMKQVWSMDYSEFVDDKGQRVFFPRTPHTTVSIYVKPFDQKEASKLPCLPLVY